MSMGFNTTQPTVTLVSTPPPDSQTTTAGPPPAQRKHHDEAAGVPPKLAQLTNLLDQAEGMAANASTEKQAGSSEEKGGPLQQIMVLLKGLVMEKLVDQIKGLIANLEGVKPREPAEGEITTVEPGIDGPREPRPAPHRGPDMDVKTLGSINSANSETKYLDQNNDPNNAATQSASPQSGLQGMMMALEKLLDQLMALMGLDKTEEPASPNADGLTYVEEYQDDYATTELYTKPATDSA